MLKDSITEIIEDIKQGKMVIILDDESRENEGDLVCAADQVTPEIINFMASKGKGLICLPMSESLIDKYNLQMMTSNNKAANRQLLLFRLRLQKVLQLEYQQLIEHTQSGLRLVKILKLRTLFSLDMYFHLKPWKVGF